MLKRILALSATLTTTAFGAVNIAETDGPWSDINNWRFDNLFDGQTLWVAANTTLDTSETFTISQLYVGHNIGPGVLTVETGADAEFPLIDIGIYHHGTLEINGGILKLQYCLLNSGNSEYRSRLVLSGGSLFLEGLTINSESDYDVTISGFGTLITQNIGELYNQAPAKITIDEFGLIILAGDHLSDPSVDDRITPKNAHDTLQAQYIGNETHIFVNKRPKMPLMIREASDGQIAIGVVTRAGFEYRQMKSANLATWTAGTEWIEGKGELLQWKADVGQSTFWLVDERPQ